MGILWKEVSGLCAHNDMRWNEDNVRDAGVETMRNMIKYAKGTSDIKERLYK